MRWFLFHFYSPTLSSQTIDLFLLSVYWHIWGKQVSYTHVEGCPVGISCWGITLLSRKVLCTNGISWLDSERVSYLSRTFPNPNQLYCFIVQKIQKFNHIFLSLLSESFQRMYSPHKSGSWAVKLRKSHARRKDSWTKRQAYHVSVPQPRIVSPT